MFYDLVLFKEQPLNLGFDKVIQIKILNIKNRKDLQRLPNKDLVIVKGGLKNKEVIQTKKVDILLDPVPLDKKDFLHHKNIGMNQVLCKLAKKNNIAIGISFSQLLGLKKLERAKMLARIKALIKLCQKYKVRVVFASFAKNKYQMRTRKDLTSVLETLNINPGEAKNMLQNTAKIIKEKELTIAPGIKLAE